MRRIFLIPRSRAIFHPRVHDLLLEIARDPVIADDSAYQGQDNGAVGLRIAAFHQDADETVDEVCIAVVYFDAGVGEGSF